ncbi:hypothetical protein FYK55_02010 [Roseiconus nitratireducens]|uniref:Uncharacterized protein n=1 Tax=Roseiconus nitratireducens TaxID=2605748 RepID=A0A5M6DI39_9BACT|nr:hypothetical protein [Roseiconus nitratireducens]KAA5547201.1 hypothetical protein FYK55_02010 [Roseiconus nitratireducens]
MIFHAITRVKGIGEAMRYTHQIALAMLMAMPTVSTLADEPTADQRLGPGALSSHRQPELLNASGFVRFQLVGGRIVLDPVRYKKGSHQDTCDAFSESITVSSSSGLPSLFYVYNDSYQRVQMVAEYGQTLRIESVLHATGECAVLEQTRGEEICWQTRRDPAIASPVDRECRGATMLHIVGQDQAGFEVHLESLMTRMLRGRSVIQLTRQTQSYLREHPSRLSAITRSEVNRLIDQLGSPRIADRRQASIELTRLGLTAAPLLRVSLLRTDLDVEQLARIRKIMSLCPRADEDTPVSLACLLSTDRDHWQILAESMTMDQRLAADQHMRRCGLDELRR